MTDKKTQGLRSGNLLQTAKHYGVDRKTLRATIAHEPEFPREKNGGGNTFKFYWDTIDDWLKTNDWYRGEREPRSEEPSEDLPQNIQKIRSDQLTKNSKSVVQTKLLELEYDKRRGVLVEREVIVGHMITVVARLAKQLELLPNLIGKKTGATDEQIRMWRDHLDQVRNAFVNDGESILIGEESGA